MKIINFAGMFRKIKYIVLIALVISICACSKYQKLLKSTDYEKKYEIAKKYYASKDYFRTIQLLDQVLIYFKGTAKADSAYYMYAYSYYYQNDYLSAAYHFKNFAVTYFMSPFTEECYYMSAYCLYLDSPVYKLDQTNTFQAIKELQQFVDLYPKSPRVAECNKILDELRLKLQMKYFEISKLYLQTENYVAAIWSFKNNLNDYPDNIYKEEILFNLIKANYLYAKHSVDSKKVERYQAAIEAYNLFVKTYTTSKFSSLAESYYKSAQKEIDKIKNIKT
jgi:outer membrane protein assembly factor BamD